MNGLHAMAAWIQQETSARRPGLDQTGVVMRTASVLRKIGLAARRYLLSGRTQGEQRS